MTEPSPDWMEIVRRCQRRWTDENPWEDAMTANKKPSPVREQLKLAYERGRIEEPTRIANWLIDGIEEALREWCHENCPSTPCESCRMAAVLERLLKGRPDD